MLLKLRFFFFILIINEYCSLHILALRILNKEKFNQCQRSFYLYILVNIKKINQFLFPKKYILPQEIFR